MHNIIIIFNNFKYGLFVCLKKPRLLFRLILGFLRGIINIRSPKCIMMALDYACNFKCEHCSAEALNSVDREKITYDQYKEVARNAKKMGVVSFCFTGGEPLLNKNNLFEIIKIFKPHENFITIQTNGWYADDEFLNTYKKSGGDMLQIGMDSHNPQEHDKFRGQKGSWEKIEKVIRSAKQKGVRIIIDYTLTHERIRNNDFYLMIEMTKKLGVSLLVVPAVPVGRWHGNAEILLNGSDRKILDRVLKKEKHVHVDGHASWKGKGCPALKEGAYITPYGEVLPCPFVHISFGNIKEKSLHDIYSEAARNLFSKNNRSICVAAEDINFIKKAECFNPDKPHFPIRYCDSAFFKSKKQLKEIS